MSNRATTPVPGNGAARDRLRTLMMAVLAIGMIGTATDLLLIDHVEDVWQLPPLLLIVLTLPIVAWSAWAPTGTSLLALRIAMILFVASGVAGIALHGAGNREFQLEMDPGQRGWPLFVKVMTAKAPPALAPGVMVQLGLFGLLSTYRHPAAQAHRGGLPHTSGDAR
jgi:hypothetical protein